MLYADHDKIHVTIGSIRILRATNSFTVANLHQRTTSLHLQQSSINSIGHNSSHLSRQPTGKLAAGGSSAPMIAGNLIIPDGTCRHPDHHAMKLLNWSRWRFHLANWQPHAIEKRRQYRWHRARTFFPLDILVLNEAGVFKCRVTIARVPSKNPWSATKLSNQPCAVIPANLNLATVRTGQSLTFRPTFCRV